MIHNSVLLAIGFVVVYYVISKINQYRYVSKFGCKPVTHEIKGWSFGFWLLKPMLKAKKQGRLLEWNSMIYQDPKNPNADTIKMMICGSTVVATRNPDNIKHILSTRFNDFDLGTRHQVLFPLLGDGIFTLDGEGWKHSRAMLRPQFAREQVSHVKLLEPHVQALISNICQLKNHQFDLQELFFKLTVDSATEFLFGESVESLRNHPHDNNFPERLNFAEAFNKSQSIMARRLLLQRFYWLINDKDFKQANQIVHDFSDHYINKALAMSQDELNSQKGYTFLYELVKQTRNPKVLRDQALNILLAGRDTTAGLLSFTFFELGRNPHIYKKLQQEIWDHFDKGENAKIDDLTFESLKKLDYLKAVINEILRLYPSVPKNFRVANKPTFLIKGGGEHGQDPIFIPKGQAVLYSVYFMQRDPSLYGKDADVFRPERWFEDSVKRLGWGFLPFNGGPRICLGQQYALTEASYVIVRLLQSFDTFTSHIDEYPPKKESNLTLSLFGSLPITVTDLKQ